MLMRQNLAINEKLKRLQKLNRINNIHIIYEHNHENLYCLFNEKGWCKPLNFWTSSIPTCLA